MNKYIGTKIVKAKPMTRLAYHLLRGWKLPEDESGDDQGYLVEYLDGGKPNLEGYKGYVSWSPKEQFDNAYRLFNNMTFGLAIEALKAGKKVARTGWNGKGMWLVYIGVHDYSIGGGGVEHTKSVNDIVNNSIGFLPWIGMKTADNHFVPWLASQSDILAEDYYIVD